MSDRDIEYRHQVEHYRNMVDASKSFVTPAIITLVLYWVLWLPGLIANIMYWREAKGIQERTGRAPAGKGCLTALLIVQVGLVILGVVLGIIVGYSGNLSSQ